jgi:hypothetical protein
MILIYFRVNWKMMSNYSRIWIITRYPGDKVPGEKES